MFFIKIGYNDFITDDFIIKTVKRIRYDFDSACRIAAGKAANYGFAFVTDKQDRVIAMFNGADAVIGDGCVVVYD